MGEGHMHVGRKQHTAYQCVGRNHIGTELYIITMLMIFLSNYRILAHRRACTYKWKSTVLGMVLKIFC